MTIVVRSALFLVVFRKYTVRLFLAEYVQQQQHQKQQQQQQHQEK